jgi:ribosomal-protein-alanine N-acetyltransferase
MTVRPATPEDAPALAAVHAACFDLPWGPAEIEVLLAAPGAFGLVAPAAHGALGLLIGRAAADEAEILTVAVAPQARGRGLGAGLVQASLRAAAELGARTLFLEVAVDNPAALATYETCGFRRAGRRPGYYARPSGVRVDALVLRRDLTP